MVSWYADNDRRQKEFDITQPRFFLVYIALSGGSPTRELAVIRHLQRYQSRGAEQFLTLLRERTAELALPA